MTERIEHRAGCLCGQVRIVAAGAPLRRSLCHCLDCRKSHGAPFVAFAIFPRDRVSVTGETRAHVTDKGYARHVCAACGSPVFAVEARGDEIELYSGSFDETSLFTPTYELWTVRREDWLGPMPTLERHFERDRPATDEDGALPG
jgi:hypothetical protein